MSTRHNRALTAHYTELEQRWELWDRTADYSKLVVPNGNAAQPFHRWFHLKEGYSADLVPRVLKDSGAPPRDHLSLLDPFAGGGTSLLSGLAHAADNLLTADVVGVERNPVLWTIAAAKTAGATAGRALVNRLRADLDQVETAVASLPRAHPGTTTSSATLNNANYFTPDAAKCLVRIREAIERHSSGDPALILRACLAASVEPAGRLRRDGRALRFEAGRNPRDPLAVFSERTQQAIDDIADTSPQRHHTSKVVLGDARRLDLAVGDREFDWIVFSPPYPNNIDYTEVYKLEAWVLGEFQSPSDMRAQRLSTLRSHPSVRFPDAYTYEDQDYAEDVGSLLQPLIESIPSDRYESGRRQLVRGYADDMMQVFVAARRHVRPDGHLVFVVGNSLHGNAATGQFTIAADLILAALGEIAGWTVTEIRIARHLRRRAETPFLRESVVVMRPT